MRKLARFTVGMMGVALIIWGWASWKYEFQLPCLSLGYFIGLGVLMLVLLLIGKVIGLWIGRASFLPIIYLVLMLVFSKESTWESIKGTKILICSGIGLLIAFVLYYLGDDGFETGWNNASSESSGGNAPIPATHTDEPKRVQTHCIFCNSPSYGGNCPYSTVTRRNSTSKIHMHNAADNKCVFCGIKNAVGVGCPHSPTGRHLQAPIA